MNNEVTFRFAHPKLALPVAVILFCCANSGYSQDPGSRPIEFSKPRASSGSTTNNERFGPERRRLTDLEDRLSTTFDFFDFDNSMSGTPAPRVPQHVTVIRRQTKRSDLGRDEKDWAFSDLLSDLKEDSDGQSLMDRLLNGDVRGNSEEKGADLLDELRSEDWLVNAATTPDPFWEMPLEAKQRSEDRSSLFNLQSRQSQQTRDSTSAPDLLPRVENLMGGEDDVTDSTTGFGNLDAASRSFFNAGAQRRDPLMQAREEARLDQYRALLGLASLNGPNTSPLNTPSQNPALNPHPLTDPFSNPLNDPLGDHIDRASQPARNPFAQSPLPNSGLESGFKPSLQPVMSADRNTLLFPMAPGASRRTTEFDSLDQEPPASSVPQVPSSVSSPFYEPPRRQF